LAPGADAQRVLPHEMCHVRQGEIFGPAYLPMHLAWGISSQLYYGNWWVGNPGEMGPSSTPPAAWPRPRR
jgi:hypothetical protein